MSDEAQSGWTEQRQRIHARLMKLILSSVESRNLVLTDLARTELSVSAWCAIDAARRRGIRDG